MALNTALALTMLGAVLLCARPERGVVALITSDAAGGFAARRLLPVAVGAPPLLGLLVLSAHRAGLLFRARSEIALLVASSATVTGVIVLIIAASLNRAAFAQQQIQDELLRLAPAQARLAALVESSSDGIISMTPDGVIVTWNAACEKIYGYPGQEIVGQPLATLVPPERAAELHAL